MRLNSSPAEEESGADEESNSLIKSAPRGSITGLLAVIFTLFQMVGVGGTPAYLAGFFAVRLSLTLALLLIITASVKYLSATMIR